MNITYTINEEFNGIEIMFDGKPDEEVRNTLKANHFRWHKQKKLWYAKQTEERLELAKKLTNDEQLELVPATSTKAEVKPEHDLKVGDLLVASWGYDQTNFNYFQVVGVMKKSVKIREVAPNRETTAVSGMAEDVRIKDYHGKLLQPAEDSFWFKEDNAKGVIRRVSENGFVKIDKNGVAHARKVDNDRVYYHSWYN